jgi:hypothetical protein
MPEEEEDVAILNIHESEGETMAVVCEENSLFNSGREREKIKILIQKFFILRAQMKLF